MIRHAVVKDILLICIVVELFFPSVFFGASADMKNPALEFHQLPRNPISRILHFLGRKKKILQF